MTCGVRRSITRTHYAVGRSGMSLCIARARPGGVLFHCVRGVDRTGIIALLLLASVGVTADDILADYELSVDPEREVFLAREHTTTRDVILSTLASLDIEAYLREGGLSQTDLETIRARLLEPSDAGVNDKV